MDDPSSGDPVSGRENNTPIPPTSQQIHEAEQFSPRQISPIAELEQEQSHASEHDQPSSAFAATTATHQSSPPPSADPPQGGTSTPTLGSDDDIPVVGTFDELSNSTEYAMNLTGGIGDDAFSNYSDEDGEDDDDRDGTYTDGTPEQQSLFVRDNSSEDVPTRKLASFKRPRTTNHKNQSSPANKRRKIPKHQQPSQAPDNSLNQAESTDDPGLVRSLLSSNIFNDIDASKGEDHEPVIVADNIPRALQQLLKLAKTEEEKKQVKRFGQNIKFIQRRIHVKELTQWRVNGMLSYLKAFQVDGVAEMLRREEQREPPRGGVFRLSNRSREDGAHDHKRLYSWDERTNRTKLQRLWWFHRTYFPRASEFRKHLAPDVLNVHVWASSVKNSRLDNIGLAKETLRKFPVILTTYSDVKLSYPKMDDPPPYAQTPSEIAAWQESYFNAHKGIFHSINFHRIVLDESQETKSDKTLGAVACTAVKAKHKWCMSGTPVLNSGLEFYSYMVFFGLAGRDKESKKAWRKEYGKQTDDRCSKRLQEEVTKWTLRRTHADSFIGSKLVTLPEAQQGIIPVYMNPVEHAVYRTVFHRFVERTRDLRDMTEEERKNNQDLSATQFTCALALLLRLRQITAHPLLVQDCMQSLLEPGDFTMLRNKLAAMQLDTRTEQDTRKHLQMMLQHAGDLPALDYEDSSNDEASSTPARESAFGSTDDFNAILDDTEQRGSVQNLARVGCPTCGKLQKNPMLTKCGHTYCNACVFEMYFVGRGNGKLQPDCIACGACISLSELTPYSQDYAPLVTAVKPSKDDRKKYQKSRAKIIIDTIASWVTGTGEVLHSSKTTAVAGKMLDILTETPDAKIICYTQFKPVIEILRRVCDDSGWKTELFHGGMKREDAQKALDAFKENPECRILLASLKKGSTGLNLTEANHVIIVDPWFNSAIEQQAFARTYRHGQEKETHLWRVIVQGSIDAQLDDMQLRKEDEIDAVMDPKKAQDPNRRRFTKQDLFSLAGLA